MLIVLQAADQTQAERWASWLSEHYSAPARMPEAIIFAPNAPELHQAALVIELRSEAEMTTEQMLMNDQLAQQMGERWHILDMEAPAQEVALAAMRLVDAALRAR